MLTTGCTREGVFNHLSSEADSLRDCKSRDLPHVVVTVAASHAHRYAEQILQALGGEKLLLGTIRDDSSFAHHDYAFDFRRNIGEVMSNQKNACAMLCEGAQRTSQFGLRREIQGIARLVDQKHLGVMNQRAADEDAALLAGRHLAESFLRQVSGLESLEDGGGTLTHGSGDVEFGPDCRAGEKPGDHGVAALGVQRPLAGQISGHDAQTLAQLKDFPALASKNTHARTGLGQRITFAGHRLDERGFAASIRAEQSHVLPCGNTQRDIVEHGLEAARDGDVFQFQKKFAGHLADALLLGDGLPLADALQMVSPLLVMSLLVTGFLVTGWLVMGMILSSRHGRHQYLLNAFGRSQASFGAILSIVG